MPGMTPLEAAEITSCENWANRLSMLAIPEPCSKDRDALLAAASVLRKIAAGEYKQVVHAYWEESNPQNSIVCRVVRCSNCGGEVHIVPYTIPLDEWAKNRHYCGRCGARMDGKDDSHEERTVNKTDLL